MMGERFFPDGMPQPLADATTLPFWQAASEHRLVVQRCTGCGHTRLPPAPVCPSCRSADSDWKEVSGRGEVYTYTVVHRPVAAGQQVPFVIAVIENLRQLGARVETGSFGADMKVALVNDGPVTIILDL